MREMNLDETLSALEDFPDLLGRVFAGGADVRRRSANGGFSLIEHVWHLADLEHEGFAIRIERLLSETDPHLPDFDGDRIARERAYIRLDAFAGLARFAAGRRANVNRMRGIEGLDWMREGTQEGVGAVKLSDLPRRMAEHDSAHASEMVSLLREIAPAARIPEQLVACARCGGAGPGLPERAA